MVLEPAWDLGSVADGDDVQDDSRRQLAAYLLINQAEEAS